MLTENKSEQSLAKRQVEFQVVHLAESLLILISFLFVGAAFVLAIERFPRKLLVYDLNNLGLLLTENLRS